MVGGPPLSRVDECQVVNNAADIGEQLRDPLPRLAILLKLVGALHQWAGVSLADQNLAMALERLAMILREHRLVVEGIHMADAAAHKQRDYGLSSGLEMRRFGRNGES